MYDYVKTGHWIMFGDYIGRVIWFVDGRRTTQLQHRFIIESVIGRRLLTDEHVHHVNGIKTDNRLENLELLTASEHAREHGLERTAASTLTLECVFCGTLFNRGSSKERHNRRQAKKGPFCGKSCAGKWSASQESSCLHNKKKLSPEQVSEIQKALSSGLTQGNTAKAFGVHIKTVGEIARGRYWLSVKDQILSRKRRAFQPVDIIAA